MQQPPLYRDPFTLNGKHSSIPFITFRNHHNVIPRAWGLIYGQTPYNPEAQHDGCFPNFPVTTFPPYPTLALPGSSVHGILQAKILEWAVMPSSRGSSLPRDQTQVSCMVGRLLIARAIREAHSCTRVYVLTMSLV